MKEKEWTIASADHIEVIEGTENTPRIPTTAFFALYSI
jgi:hypothetical protein